jgi:hypothetical protein
LALCLIVKFNHTADSIVLIVVDTILCGIGFVCFNEFIQGIVVVQLNSHLQSNTLELDDKAQTLSYEHYYPYSGTAIIAGKDKTQVQQKRK